MNQKAVRAFTEIAEFLWMMPMPHVHRKPGQTFNSLPEETKELLRELKSDDLKQVRWPPGT